MNRPLSLRIIALLVGVSLGLGYWLGTRPASGPQAVAAAAGDGEAKGRRLLYYRNPMGLPDTSPTPKKDSMGMDYIPVYEGEEPDDSGAVRVSPARVQTLGVKTARAEMRALDAGLRAVGRVEVNERNIQDIAPRFQGWIERLFVNATGDPVAKGQPLFSVYSPELVSAQQEVRIAEQLQREGAGANAAAREGALRLAEAARERLKNWDIRAQGEGADPQRPSYVSPVDGIVLEKKAVEGMQFMPGTAIFRIADLSSVWLIADIYEQDLARVKLGQEAAVVIDAYPDKRFSAKITYLYPTLNTATRTTPVRLEIQNPGGLLRPGMFAHVELALAGSKPRLTVPKSAIIDSGSRQVVLVALDEGKYKPQAVKVGMRGPDDIEILEGLKADDIVVVSANFLIDSESNLRAALSGFGEPEGAKQAKSFEADGTFDAHDSAAATVTLTHKPIPALKWPGMTMDFGLASPTLVQGLLPDQPIHFRFEDRGNGQFVVTAIERVTHGSGGH
ncbi:MAG: efflux RND transporter periplasmic adaptor subunit [Gammaproteobacteria bacterium]|nr:efflux RND transporter periplasmic adaptor subunit [Gammaproteobacteria bacterium]MBU1653700.1 efflux RND transporter periplasmic adaptor subunit [Gammaproteobacteria bacterium]MBU1959678.1 efflux RND transporter periplasmic adaptor subunit [Gammaproteobacteria bacterium]